MWLILILSLACTICCAFAGQCMSKEFECSNSGRCILARYRCDGVPDCSDRSDESQCDTTHTASTMSTPGPADSSTNRFSIEKVSCKSWQFLCASGECITSSGRCDGWSYDCPDNSDEKNCSLFLSTSTTSTLRSTTLSGGLGPYEESDTPQMCNDINYLWCTSMNSSSASGKGSCVPNWYFCDGLVDCFAGADEKNCPNKSLTTTTPSSTVLGPFESSETAQPCRPGFFGDYFWCRYTAGALVPSPTMGRCVPKSYICDGMRNCFDGTDEQNCSELTASSSSASTLSPFRAALSPFEEAATPQACRMGSLGPYFWCRLKDDFTGRGRCIPEFYKCDGASDCYAGIDESNCPAQQSTNPTTMTHLSSALLAGGSSTNPFGLEELTPSVTQETCRNPSNFWCKYPSGLMGRCLPASWKCDGKTNCHGGTDEQNCPNRASSSPFLFSSIFGGARTKTTTTPPDPVNDHRGEWMGQLTGWVYRNAVNPDTMTANIIGKRICLVKGADDPQSLYSSLFGVMGMITTPAPANDHRGDWQAQVFLWAFRNTVDLDKVTARISGDTFCLE
ncbi:hypothetical protein BV898_15800 [Hypsibius exemplaris]|uniref:Uncharacterized protein n=1 Tax=Hypsibius exemplaris TaxID=2072580 RepID=A0A9X6NDS4_HYPEX|nr:hypothetical protein BV898_15800 [Hypsibius exemplaris]